MSTATPARTGTWVVFARRKAPDPLTRIGSVEVGAGATVADVARAAHGEDWIEMVAIPEEAMAWAITEEGA